MFVFMPQYVTWSKKEKGSSAVNEFRPLFARLQDELNAIGHQLECSDFATSIDGNREHIHTRFLLADYKPLVTAYVEATRWIKENSTEFLLGVRHFSVINTRFERLEEIAGRYGFKPDEPFSSRT